MYFEEENNYGLVSIKDNTVSTLKDYSYYSSEIKTSTQVPLRLLLNLPPPFPEPLVQPTPTIGKHLQTCHQPQTKKCECMSASLKCVVDDKVDSDDYSDLFSTFVLRLTVMVLMLTEPQVNMVLTPHATARIN